MDELDRAILQRLLADGRAPLQDISEQVGLRRPSVHERVRRLRAEGVIRGFHADVDPQKLDAGLVAYVLIEVALGAGGKQDCMACCESLAEKLRKFPEVIECHTMAGTEDMLVKLRVKDLPHLERLVMREVSGLEGVRRVVTKIALRTHFERSVTVRATPRARPKRATS